MPARRITIPPLKEFTSSDLAKHCSSERRVGQSGAPAAPLARAVPVATAAHSAPFQCPWPPHLQRLDWEALSGAQALLSSAEAWMCGRRAACGAGGLCPSPRGSSRQGQSEPGGHRALTPSMEAQRVSPAAVPSRGSRRLSDHGARGLHGRSI